VIALEVSSAAGRPPYGGIGGSVRNLVGALLRIDPATPYRLCYRFSRWRKGELFRPEAPNARVRVIQDPLNACLLRGARVFHSMGLFMPATPRIPRALTVYDLNPVRNPQWTRAAWTARRAPRYRAAIARSDCIVTTSEFIAAELRDEYALPAERVRVIPLGVDAAVFHPADAATRARVRARWGDYVIAIGLLTPRKNFPRLIEAMAALKDVRLLLVGRPSDGEAQVREAIERCGMRERVVHLQRVPEAELVDLIGAARACAVASLYEGFGLTALEALACGTPLVCSRAASLPEVVGDAGLVVDATDAAALAAALERVVGDAALAERLREAGRARALSLSWEESARGHRALYRELGGL
jgi:glycosyltransferase involved in cell wall biosynthesis